MNYQPGTRVIVDSPVLQGEYVIVKDNGPNVYLKADGDPDILATLVMKSVIKAA